jgi:hypothetical protein
VHAHEPARRVEQPRPAPRRPVVGSSAARTPGRLTPGAIPGLQRAAGNAAVAGLLRARRRAATERPAQKDAGAAPGTAVSGSATADGRAAATPAAAPAGPMNVQRNVGIELEDTTWSVTENGQAIEKGVPVVHRPFFQLQGEYGGKDNSNIEFVTNRPGVLDRTEWTTMRDGVVDLAGELRARNGQRPFSAAELAGGDGRYMLHPSYKFDPFLQVTAGVPLAAIPALFDNLKGKATINAPGVESVRASADKLRGDQRAQGGPDSGPASEGKGKEKGEPEPLPVAPGGQENLLGLITMVRTYLAEGDLNATNQRSITFLKGLTKVMARTDFATMFMLLSPEERQTINQDKAAWVAAMVEGLQGDADAPVLGQVAYDQHSGADAMRLTTSRRDWLTEMTSTGAEEHEQPGRDILSVRGKLAGPDPDPEGPEDQADARRLAVGVEHAEGTRGKSGLQPDDLDFTAVNVGLTELQGRLEELFGQLKDLHEGFGSLGSITDTLRYEGDERPTPAVIVEIRSPTKADWSAAMDEIYNAVEAAIAGPDERKYTNELSDEGKEARRRAEEQREAVEAQPRVASTSGGQQGVGGAGVQQQRVGRVRRIGQAFTSAFRSLAAAFHRLRRR